jgi:hypothetical protein
MDLLTYAEVLLHQRDMDNLTDEEKTLIEKQLAAASDAGLSWPEEEPVIEDSKSEATEGESLALSAEPVTSEDVVAPAGAEAQVAEVEDDVAQEAVTEGQESVLKAEEVATEAASEEALAETELPDGAELEQSFTTEPIEESLGWVVTDSEEDYYSGWEDVAEETPDKADERWVPEPFEEPRESPKPGKKGKKRKKRGGKSRYQRSSRS